ncbi:hypothetical protein BRC86_00270 [Halobacteriales archaeon QS_3_64_16]|jgi:hypothetical protein|nr:MAG: hypothetical protein BRC86_00270 [Halobacteriales archaeon QS_3_64_16]
MADNDSGTLLGGNADNREVTVETKSRPRELRDAIVTRWLSWSVVIVTAVTTYYLYTIGGGWTLDATTFALSTVGILGYTLLSLSADVD